MTSRVCGKKPVRGRSRPASRRFTCGRCISGWPPPASNSREKVPRCQSTRRLNATLYRGRDDVAAGNDFQRFGHQSARRPGSTYAGIAPGRHRPDPRVPRDTARRHGRARMPCEKQCTWVCVCTRPQRLSPAANTLLQTPSARLRHLEGTVHHRPGHWLHIDLLLNDNRLPYARQPATVQPCRSRAPMHPPLSKLQTLPIICIETITPTAVH